MMRWKDEEISKLREDNSNMFKDLRDFAENDQSLKLEVNELKQRKIDVEHLNEELRERTHNQEVKLRSLQLECEKIKRDAAMKVES